MKKSSIFLKIFLLVFCSLVLCFATSCKNNPDEPGKEACKEHVDANKDGKCDVCGEKVEVVLPPCEEHVDADKDGKCDVCGETVEVEKIDVSGVKFFSSIYTYDGKPHELSVSKLPSGVTVEYEGNGQTEVGVYNVTATLKDSKGNVLSTLKATLTIKKVAKDVSKVEFVSQTFEWEYGKKFELTAKNVPEGVKVVYENNTREEIGAQTAVVKLYDEFDNELLKTLEATLTIKYKVVNDESIFASKSFVTDGKTAYKLEVSAGVLKDGDTVEYSNNVATEQGVYYASALVKRSDNSIIDYHALLKIDNPNVAEFDKYSDEMFIYFLEGDQSTLNIFTADYKAFGFEHQEAKWYTYEKYTDEDYQSDLKEIARLVEEFESFDYNKLSFAQQNTWATIKSQIDNLSNLITKNKEFLMMRLTYIDQWGGYCGDMPTTMEAYQLRTREDIEDMISYIDSSYEAFMSYIDYVNDKAEAGYPISDFTLANMIKYLDGVSKRNMTAEDEGYFKPYYLIEVLENKIKNVKKSLELTDAEVEKYLAELNVAFNEKFLPAHKDLAEGLEKCKGKGNGDNQYYLASYGDAGKELYEILLRNRLGITMPMDEYINFLDTTIAKYYNLFSSYSVSGEAQNILDGKVLIAKSNEPADLIEYLKEFAKTIVPNLETEPVIDVAYMDETATENTTTLAYYMKSALDSWDNEYIHLNKQALGKDYLETIKTMAHEGYPGHLYAYVNTKENKNLSNITRVSTNTGHGEGWAKYVEIALADYIIAQKNNRMWTIALNYSKYWDLFVYNLYTRLDVGIHYQGWGLAEIQKFMSNNNLRSDESIARDLMTTLVEMPGQYAAYGYGQAYFYEVHDEAKKVLGDNYSEIEFNAMLLEHGWVQLSLLDDYYNQYMTEKCFLYGIDFEK